MPILVKGFLPHLAKNTSAGGIRTLNQHWRRIVSDRLQRLFRPRSIAVIGGGAVGRFVLENCAKVGFDGPVWQVHPTRGDVGRVRDLGAPPDAVFVGVNRDAAIDVVAELAEIGAGGAVVYASGFSEAEAELGDGAGLQARLIAAAGDMPVIGPNCYGFVNYLDGAALWPDQQGGRRLEKGVAIVTQSSNIAINLTMQRRGVPLAYIATAGNQAQTGLAEIGEALLEDARVTVLGLHIEGIGNLRALEGLASMARRLGKPIVALKAGRSEQARAAAVSHTASLAGSAAAASALLKRLGIAEVRSFPEFLETLKLLHVTGPLGSDRIASLSCSGGEASLMADSVEGRALAFPPLSAQQREALRAALGPRVALANPLDYHTYIWADTEAMTKAYAAMMTADYALGAVVADFPRADRCSAEDWEPVIAATAAAGQASGVPMAIVATLPENMPEDVAQRLAGMGIAPLGAVDEALAAIEAAAFLGQEIEAAPVWLPGAPVDVRLFGEAEAKAALAGHGVEVPVGRRCDLDGLDAAAWEMVGPFALKAEGMAHKTEVGGVVLGLDPAALRDAAVAMGGTAWLVEEMVSDGVAELLIGVLRDPAHGLLLTIAAGGVWTEVLADSASALLPVTEEEVRGMLGRLRLAPVLRGYRGKPAADVEAIVSAVMAVQSYVGAHPGQIEEVEINPLICTPARAVAVDALIRIGERDE